MTTRILVVISLTLILLSVLADPYAYYLTGSDGHLAAPAWQTAAARGDIILLALGAVTIVLGLQRAALVMLANELLYALGLNALLVHRDGNERFIWGFGAERHLVDFVIVFGLRLLILIAIAHSLLRARSRAA